uniref:GNAT family N-acetyltransferase n=1 Tax=Roseivirga sp. TaxID=1964215 RepID=UPI004048284F
MKALATNLLPLKSSYGQIMAMAHGHFFVDDRFAGWGGLQPEHGDADLALVLDPKYWGIGKLIYKRIIDTAFNEMGLTTVTVLFPNTRVRIKGLLRLGFKEDGHVKIGDQQFVRFRNNKPIKS